ncbi:MAG: sigma-54-dependent transcriptional regulator [Aureispira sp.]
MEYPQSKFRIFIVEDDPLQSRLIKYVMESDPDHEVHVFNNGKDCLAQLHLNPDLVSLDYYLPDMNGAAILKKIKEKNALIQVIVLSGQKDINTAIKLIKQGADDYVTKNAGMEERLSNSVRLLKQNSQLKKEVSLLREQLSINNTRIIGQSAAMKPVLNLVSKAAQSSIVVSITGETGTGKEVVAKSIHYNSNRKEHKFVAINMAAIPKELIESELFGYEKGAFTGAATAKKGKFELAHNGTLFLDEIGDLDLSLQAKLLRAIQEQEITRIGGNKTICFDARIIIATHKNLFEEVHKGNFREDLYYRVLGLSIDLPPLRTRGADILILAQYFLRNYAKKNQTSVKKLSRIVKDKLLSHHFPGNVRELRSIIELAVVLCDKDQIKLEHLQLRNKSKNFNLVEDELTMRNYAKKIIKHFLSKYDNDVTLVARKLDIGRSTIYKMLKEDSNS